MSKGKQTVLLCAMCCALFLIVSVHPANAQDRSSREYITGGYITGTIFRPGALSNLPLYCNNSATLKKHSTVTFSFTRSDNSVGGRYGKQRQALSRGRCLPLFV
jgi:hypothetical protein